jgi:hypothetical protein
MSGHDSPASLADGYDEEYTARLKQIYARLLQDLLNLRQNPVASLSMVAVERRLHKELILVAFLSHPEATEEDFERLWPRLRDDELCNHANNVYRQTRETIKIELATGRSLEDIIAGDSD